MHLIFFVLFREFKSCAEKSYYPPIHCRYHAPRLPGSQLFTSSPCHENLEPWKNPGFLKNCLEVEDVTCETPFEGRQIVWHTPEDSPWSFRRPHPPISGEFQAWATRTCQRNPKQLGVPEPLTIPPVSCFSDVEHFRLVFFLCFFGCRVFMGVNSASLEAHASFLHPLGAPFFVRVLQMPVTMATDSVRDVAHAVPTSEYPRWRPKPQGKKNALAECWQVEIWKKMGFNIDTLISVIIYSN